MQDSFTYLRSMPFPRRFVWYGFVKLRRSLYFLASLGLLGTCVGIPLWYFIGQLRDQMPSNHNRPNQIALYFGALVVVAFVRYSYVLHKLWDDSKWLSRHGRMEEANLLWVIKSDKRLLVTYRFWTPEGLEIQKETVIDADGIRPLADLQAGDVVPVLYDPRSPGRRSMLWAEVERYVTALEAPSSAKAASLDIHAGGA